MNARLYDPMLHRFLQTDNYIQDITNTQNYNQYGYVYNNPLLYIDPSGNASQGGGDCIDCGLTPGQQVGAGGLIGTIVNNWDNWRIKDWAKKNFNGDNFSEWWKSKISINNIFGRHKNSGPPPNRSNYVAINFLRNSISTMNNNSQLRKEKLAKKLSMKYQANKNRILAESLVAEALMEITDPGELLTNFREKFDLVYGTQQSNEINEVYSSGIGIIRGLKKGFGAGKVTDVALFKASMFLVSDVLYLSVENGNLSDRIENLDKDTFYKYIDPTKRPRQGRFSGGGSGGNWN